MESPSGPLLLQELAQKHGNDLPLVISAHKSTNESTELQKGKKYEVYFKREATALNVKIALGACSYVVPLHSTFKFSVLYNPRRDHDLSTARRGYCFDTVAELMKTRPLPTVVYVGQRFSHDGEAIKKGTLLLIKEIVTEKHHFMKVKRLKCMKMGDSKEIYLKESCEGHFSTRESLLLFSMSALLKYFKPPISTSMYDCEGKAPESQFKYKSGCIISAKPSTLHSIIVSPVSSLPLPTSSVSSECTHQLIELFTSLPMEFNIVSITQEAKAQLNQKRSSILQSIAPENVDLMYTLGTKDQLQKNLFLPVNNSEWIHEIVGIDDRTVYEPIVIPSTRISTNTRVLLPNFVKATVVDHLPPSLPPRRRHSTIDTCSSSDSRSNDVSRRSMSSFEYDEAAVYSPPTNDDDDDNDYTEMIDPTEIRKKADSISTSEKELAVLPDPNEISIEGMSLDIESLNLSVASATAGESTPLNFEDTNESFYENEPVFLEVNKSLLLGYDHNQISTLLGMMEMEQYIPKFKEEQIDGPLLFELDDEILEEELGVSKKVHRLRLMMIITGHQCVTEFIKFID